MNTNIPCKNCGEVHHPSRECRTRPVVNLDLICSFCERPHTMCAGTHACPESLRLQAQREKETVERTFPENGCPFCRRPTTMCAGSRSCVGSLKAQRAREAAEKAGAKS
jgi:hypothetical protein